jgi:erythromycin esterase-like protein
LADSRKSQERAVQEQFEELQRGYNTQTSRKEEWFSALQNARVVKSAEEYYRVSLSGGESSWNLRDRHMADTLDALLAHLGTESKPARLVVWAHNSHVGDARHTTMGESGEWNVGQLMRQRRPKETFCLVSRPTPARRWQRRAGISQARCGKCVLLFLAASRRSSTPPE